MDEKISLANSEAYKGIFFSFFFALALLLTILNSIFQANDFTNSIGSDLSRFGVDELTFTLAYFNLTKELIPVSVGVNLSWMMVIHRQFVSKKSRRDYLTTCAANILFIFPLIIAGIASALVVVYVLVDTIPPDFQVGINEIITVVVKGICFALVLWFCRQIQVKYIQIMESRFYNIAACCLLALCSIAGIVGVDLFLNMFLN